MRRALRKRLPLFTQFYGITPAQFDEMTVAEVVQYFRHLDKTLAEQQPQHLEIEGG